MKREAYAIYTTSVNGNDRAYALVGCSGREVECFLSNDEEEIHTNYLIRRKGHFAPVVFGFNQCFFSSDKMNFEMNGVSLDEMRKICAFFGESIVGKRIYRAYKVDLRKNIQQKCFFVHSTNLSGEEVFSINYFLVWESFVEHLRKAYGENRKLVVDANQKFNHYYHKNSDSSFLLEGLSDKEIKKIKKETRIEFLL